MSALEALRNDEEVRSISRRYFISNGFDRTLTSIGTVFGSYLSAVPDGTTVLAVVVVAAVGLGTSGVWSGWEIERAEKQAELFRIEETMLAELEDIELQRKRICARKVNAVASGIGPLIGIIFPLLPFLLEGLLLSMLGATLFGIVLGVSVRFVFGSYLGFISKQNWVVAGLRMALAGIVVALVNLALPT